MILLWMTFLWIPSGMWLWIITVLLGIVGYVLYVLLSTSGSAYSDNSLDAFIIQDNGDSNPKISKEKENPKTSHYNRVYSTEGRQLLILYGTEYGFSEEVAHTLFDRILSLVQPSDKEPLQPRLVNTKHHKCMDFSREQVCLVVISTSGDGVPPTDARSFYDNLMSHDEDLGHLKYSVLAMGDSNYPHFCKTGRDIDARLSICKAERVIKCQDVDMEDWNVINFWIDNVVQYLGSCDINVGFDYLQMNVDDTDNGHSRHLPFMATLKVKELLTEIRCDSDKETIHCEFDITGSNMTWTSGDALGIYPQNNPAHVDAILDQIKWSETELFPLPSWAYHPHNDTGVENLRTLLIKYCDIKHIKPELLQQIFREVKNAQHCNRLEALLLAGTGKSNLSLWEYISVHEVRDVMQEFGAGILLPCQLLPFLKPLQPRYYSISSSPLKDPNTVCVTAAILRYNTASVDREGVTTAFLQDRTEINEACPVFMSRNPDFCLPDDHTTPIILIGPGTGVAPFRAFIQERELYPDRGETRLYFGCRHRCQDFLYKDELEKYNQLGIISLRVAFSRDQTKKVYVQDLLQEDSVLIWELISKRNCQVYVCGDARHMAKDVHKTLLDIVQCNAQMDRQAAINYLDQLESQGCYQKDVWVT